MSTTDQIQKAIRFLKRVYPLGPWCLTAIDPNDKGIETRTFYPDDPVPDVGYDTSEAGCEAWLLKWYGKRNLYWHVNPVMSLLQKKAEREDIRGLCWLHVDADCRNDPKVQSIEDQRAYILKMLTSYKHKPTIIIDSGGGFQAFWRLTEELPLGGDLARCEDAKRYNQQLEQDLNGDNCHNIDRLMRLPYTVNLPNGKKLAKGRVPVETCLLEFNDNVYPLSTFRQAAVTTGLERKASASVSVAAAKRISDLAELDEWRVPDRVKVIIAQGLHPDPEEIAKKTAKRGGKPPSRSEWLFDAVCQLVRSGVPDDIIFGIITDAAWGISESVIELKGQAERYALKQIVSAHEYTVDPVLAEFNDRYFVTQTGGKTLVGEFHDQFIGKDEDGTEVRRRAIRWLKLEDFQNFWEYRKVQVGTDKEGNPRNQEAGKWWRKHEQRRQYRGITFRPDLDQDVVDGELNLWRAFGVEAGSGDRHLPFKHFVRDIICNGDPVQFDYLWKWMGRKVQRPDLLGEVAIGLRGIKGTGKTFFCKTFASLFGQHGIVTGNGELVVGKFNAPLRECCLLVIDEAFVFLEKKSKGLMKTRVTGDTIHIERKGIDIEEVRNMLGIMIISNDEKFLDVTDDERRYFAVEVDESRVGDHAYFKGLAKSLKEGGLSDLLGDLQRVDLTGFEVRAVPQTAALAAQKVAAKSSVLEERVQEVLEPFDTWGAAFYLKDLFNVLGLASKVTDRAVIEEVKAALYRRGYKNHTIEPAIWNGERFKRGKAVTMWYQHHKLVLEVDKPGVTDDWVVVGGFKYSTESLAFIADAEARVQWALGRIANVESGGITFALTDGKLTVIPGPNGLRA